MTGLRFAGGLAISVTSRSPKTVCASVRGIGVAVMCSTCGVVRAERAPLLDAEAVLLVHDGDGERAELDLLLDERMRADRDVGLAARQPVADGAALRGRHGAREQLAADAEVVADSLDGEEVLLGQGLRRRHQRALVAVLDRPQERVERDDRLPRADVALQEPLHRPLIGEVAADLRGSQPPAPA